MALDRIRQVLLNLADDEELGIRIKEVSGVSVPALLSDITMVAIQHASDLKDFSDNIGRSPRQEDEYSFACIGQLTIGEHSFP